MSCSKENLEPGTQTNESGGQVRMLQKKKIDVILGTSTGCYKCPFEDTFKILGRAMNRQRKTCGAGDERLTSANKTFWKDILLNKSKDVP